ncbi:MAG: hypothetical protein AAGB51_04970 [Planctomycetota bacterium]
MKLIATLILAAHICTTSVLGAEVPAAVSKYDTGERPGEITPAEARAFFADQSLTLHKLYREGLPGERDHETPTWEELVYLYYYEDRGVEPGGLPTDATYFQYASYLIEIGYEGGEHPELGEESARAMPIAQFAKLYVPAKPEPNLLLPRGLNPFSESETVRFGLLLRDSGDAGVLAAPLYLAAATPKQQTALLKSANGAKLSYTHNLRDDDTTWYAKGALIAPLVFTDPAGPLQLSTAALSIDFDRQGTTADGAPERSELTAKLTGVFEFGDDRTELLGNTTKGTAHTLTLSAAYATDFDFESSTVAAEAIYTPTPFDNRWAIGRIRNDLLWGTLGLRWRPEAVLRYGTTLDAGDVASLEDNDVFLRIGPRASVDLYPSWAERLSVTMSYEYLAGLVGNEETVDQFSAKLKWDLIPNGQLALEAEYLVGESPLLASDTETVSVALSLKY